MPKGTPPPLTDAAVGTGSLRTLGTGSQQAAGGNATGPAIHGYLGWTCDIEAVGGTFNPTAGAVWLSKLFCPYAITINTIDLCVQTGGTGATPLANCYVGIYDSSGNRQFLSADQSTPWASVGMKAITVSGGYTTVANGYIYLALLIGTQSTTQCKVTNAALGASNLASANLTNAAYRCGFNSSALSALPSSLTLSSTSFAAQLTWFGVR